MPWDLAANLGIKFTFARNGVLVLTGLVVDPGFGLKPTVRGWRPKSDERLHFVLVNLGQREFVIQPGIDQVASLQFLPVIGSVKKRYVPSGADMEREFFGSSVPAMGRFALFHSLRDVQERTTTELTTFSNRLEVIQAATDRVLVFGVYLFAVTLLVAGTAALLDFLASDRAGDVLENLNRALPAHGRWPEALVLAALLLAIAFVLRGVLEVVAAICIQGRRRRQSAVESALRSDRRSGPLHSDDGPA